MSSINSSQIVTDKYDGIPFPALPYILMCLHKNGLY
jgi:hypothetical protein